MIDIFAWIVLLTLLASAGLREAVVQQDMETAGH